MIKFTELLNNYISYKLNRIFLIKIQFLQFTLGSESLTSLSYIALVIHFLLLSLVSLNQYFIVLIYLSINKGNLPVSVYKA